MLSSPSLHLVRDSDHWSFRSTNSKVLKIKEPRHVKVVLLCSVLGNVQMSIDFSSGCSQKTIKEVGGGFGRPDLQLLNLCIKIPKLVRVF
jgi:hypothetical protein